MSSNHVLSNFDLRAQLLHFIRQNPHGRFVTLHLSTAHCKLKEADYNQPLTVRRISRQLSLNPSRVKTQLESLASSQLVMVVLESGAFVWYPSSETEVPRPQGLQQEMRTSVTDHYDRLISHVEERVIRMRAKNRPFKEIEEELDYLTELRKRRLGSMGAKRKEHWPAEA